MIETPKTAQERIAELIAEIEALPPCETATAKSDTFAQLKPRLVKAYTLNREVCAIVAPLIKEKCGIAIGALEDILKTAVKEAKHKPPEQPAWDPPEYGDYDHNPIAYLQDLEQMPGTRDAHILLTELVPDIAALLTTDPGAVGSIAALVKEKLGIARRDFDSAVRPLAEPREKPNQAAKLVKLAAPATLFHTKEEEGWATIQVDTHMEHWPVHAGQFRRWLSHQYFLAEDSPPGSQALQDAINTLEGKAFYEGPVHEVNLRIAEDGNTLYLDLANDAWQAVAITATGWRVIDQAPVWFRRTKGMEPLPIPQKGGKLADLWKFINVREEDRPLLLAWLLMTFAPRGPYPILMLGGGAGSTKTTIARALRRCGDPNMAGVRKTPRTDADVMIAANAGRVVAYDNLSTLPTWLSDAFCRLATEDADGQRTLYTNTGETLQKAQRPIVFTSIADLAIQDDIIDRGIRLVLPKMEKKLRKAEKALWQEFEKAHPLLLGALLDVLVTILKNRHTLVLPELPRMADFALWACAAGDALGCTTEKFLHLYDDNRFTAHRDTLDASLVAKAVFRLMEKLATWEGTASELLERLEHLDPPLTERETQSKEWPKNPLSLSNAVKRLVPSLETVGITVEFSRVGGDEPRRLITLTKEQPQQDPPKQTPPQQDPPHTGNGATREPPPEHTHIFSGLRKTEFRKPLQNSVTNVTRVTKEAGLPSDTENSGFISDARDDCDAEMQTFSKMENSQQQKKVCGPFDYLMTPEQVESAACDACDERDERDAEMQTFSKMENSQQRKNVCVPYGYLTKPEQLEAVLPELLATPILGLDIETTGLDPRTDRISTIQLATGSRTFIVDAFTVPVQHLAPLFSTPHQIVGHNLGFELSFFLAVGLPVPPWTYFDSMIASHLLLAREIPKKEKRPKKGEGPHTLKAVAKAALGIEMDKEEQQGPWSIRPLTPAQLRYAAFDAEVPLLLMERLQPELASADLTRIAAIEHRCLPALALMEHAGVSVDEGAWRAFAVAETQRAAALAPQLAALMDTATVAAMWKKNAAIKTAKEAEKHAEWNSAEPNEKDTNTARHAHELEQS